VISPAGPEIVNTLRRALALWSVGIIAAVLITVSSAGSALACASNAAPIDPAIAALTSKRGDECTIEVDRRPDNGQKITIRGRSFNGRRLIKAIVNGSDDQETRQVLGGSWDIEVARLKGFNDEELSNVVFKIERSGGDVTDFSLAARLGNADLTGRLQTQDDGRRTIVITTENAGAFLRAIDVFPHLFGGATRLSLGTSSDRIKGTLKIEKVTLAQIAMLRSLDMLIPGRPGRRRSTRLEVSRLRLDFERTTEPGQLKVTNGTIYGPTIGATFDGTFDISHGLNFAGTIIPVAINNSPGPLPLFINGEGLISLTYRIIGPMTAPRLQINPFGLTPPGFLRRIFTLEP
jgi:hypothetical protein